MDLSRDGFTDAKHSIATLIQSEMAFSGLRDCVLVFILNLNNSGNTVFVGWVVEGR